MGTGETLDVRAHYFPTVGHQPSTGVELLWTIRDTTIATVLESGGDAFGLHAILHAKAPGSTTLTVTGGGARTTSLVTVSILPVARLTITPDVSGIILGMKQTYMVETLDSRGRSLPGRRVTWASSNPAVASVDAAGVVTALQNGMALIWATSEGKADTATTTVLPRPVANWSGAVEDWTTYQGTARHAGFVPATSDPRSFTRRWEVEAEASFLNQATFGAGLVFTSSRNPYVSEKKLHAFDAVNGTSRWSHNFGVNVVTPPASSDGSAYVATRGVDQGSFLWSFNAANGDENFHALFANYSPSGAPVIVGQSVFVTAGYYGGLYAFSTADGVEQWFARNPWREHVSPTVENGRVYAYVGDVPELRAFDASTGVEEYSIDSHGSGSIALGSSDNLVAVQQQLISFDLAARTIAWEVEGSFAGQATIADGVIYVQNGVTIEARRESDGSLLWWWLPPDGGATASRTMVATHNLLFVSSLKATYAIDLTEHLPVWWYPASGLLSLSKDGLLVIAQDNGMMTAISLR